MQLHLVLPTGPREYWVELATEHKNAPPHMKWMYEADPFAAREAKAAKEREKSAVQEGSSRRPTGGQTSGEFSQAPEVKMATSLREFVENSIKRVY